MLLTARPTLLTSRWVFLDAERRLDGGGVLVERGSIALLFADRGAVERFARRSGARAVDLGERVLAPGFVDAHAHLELSSLEGRLPGRGSFTAWIRALVAARSGLSRAGLRASALRGAERLIAGGTTAVGDVDATGASEPALKRSGLRARIYREVLDAGDPARARAALARATRAFPRGRRLHPGLSPHAPYTASPGLLRASAGVLARQGWLAQVHWAETEEEVLWLARREGPMRALFPGAARRRSRGPSGLDLLDESGLLGPRTALVHGNHPGRGDVERVARAGCALVHCPGTHAFFGRDPFPLRRWLGAGVAVALGTDGLSSNRGLDMRREMALLRASQPALSAARTFDLATRGGARALGFLSRAGEIAPGAWADLAAHGFPDLSSREARSPDLLLDALTRGRSTVDAVWIDGRRVLGGPDFQGRPSESLGRIAE